MVEPSNLGDYFGLLLNVYEKHRTGKPLSNLLKLDWQLFQHPSMDDAHVKELIADIFDDGEIVRKLFIPSPTYASDGLIQWETLKTEIMSKNRWFLSVKFDTDRLKGLLDLLLSDELQDTWHRARLQVSNELLSIDQMGAPPNGKATNGRANPAGIPYLYLGSTPETAVSEVRPHTGEIAFVADFKIPTPLRAVDLRNPRKHVSPFLLDDASSIGQLMADLPLLERLGEELTRPVLPSVAAIEYIPSQYLCELIKQCGHDGVIYKSSVSTGFNLALFDPSKATGGSVHSYRIEKVIINSRPM